MGIDAMNSKNQRQWLLSAVIASTAVCLFWLGGRFTTPANVQAQLQTGYSEGVMVIPIQLERDLYGLAMVDTNAQTLWVYEVRSRGPAYNRLKLLAARSWRYDKLLKQYNTADPNPEQVKLLLESLTPTQKRNSQENILEIAEPDNGSADMNEK